jgi:hypothetical protein
MIDCNHLRVIQGGQLNPWISSEPVRTCALKTTADAQQSMASQATIALGLICPPNTECHYYVHDRCQSCESYTNAAQGGANVDA